MYNSGYVLVDCEGLDLGDLGTVDGLYDKVKAAVGTGKPIILAGIVNGTQSFSPIAAYGGIESTTSVFLSFFPITLHIDSDDAVTI